MALAFAGTAGWLSPSRLSGADVADVLERHNGEHPGFRRAHEKGICIVGHFDSNGLGQPLSKAAVFASGRTPVFGRFALAVGSPYAPDGVPAPRSLALDLTAQIGRAAGRERVCQYGEITGVAVTLKKTQQK